MKKLLIILSFILIFIASCVDTFDVKWDVNFTLPLMDKSFPLADIEDGENILIIDDEFIIKQNGVFEGDTLDPEFLSVGYKEISTEIPPIAGSMNNNLPISELGAGEGEEQIGFAFGDVKDWTLKVSFDLTGVDNTNMQIITLTFPDIHPNGDDDLQFSITNFHTITSVNLDNCTIGDINSHIIDDILESIQFGIEVEINSEIPAGEFPVMKIYFEQLKLRKMKGIISNKTITINDQISSFEIDYPMGIENSVELTNAQLQIEIENQIGMDCSLYAIITARNAEQDSAKFYIGYQDPEDLTTTEFLISAAEDFETPTITTRNFDGPKISNLLNVFPDQLVISDAYIIVEEDIDIADENTPLGFAEIDKGAFGEYEAVIPFNFYLNDEVIRPDSIFSIEISADNSENLTENARSANIVFELENSMRFAGDINIFLSSSDNRDNVFDTLYIDPYSGFQNLCFNNKRIEAATATELGTSEITVELDENDIWFFNQEEIFIGIELYFDESDEIVTVSPNDYINVFSTIEAEIKIELGGN